MRKFPCLLFVLKQWYVLLYNLHDVLMYEETFYWESKEVLYKKE